MGKRPIPFDNEEGQSPRKLIKSLPRREILNSQFIAWYFISTSWVNSASLFSKVSLRNSK